MADLFGFTGTHSINFEAHILDVDGNIREQTYRTLDFEVIMCRFEYSSISVEATPDAVVTN
jgi:hypothetical protein